MFAVWPLVVMLGWTLFAMAIVAIYLCGVDDGPELIPRRKSS